MKPFNMAQDRVKSKKYWICIIVTLLAILMSKTVIVGIIYFRYFNILFLIICFLILLVNKFKITTNNFSTCIVLTIFLGFSYLSRAIFLNDTTGLELTIDTIIQIFQAMIIVSCVKKRDYENIYINIIVLMSIISLLCFLLTIINPFLASSISIRAFATDSTVPIHASFYYTWGWGDNVINSRNSGMFWEPGAFQGFLCIAILMLILTKYDIKHRVKKFTILVITVLTTQSTTGYIILMLILLVYYSEIINLFSDKTSQKLNMRHNKILIGLVISVFIIAAIMYITNSATLVDKLNADNSSTNIRTDDILNGIRLFLEHPVLGTGFGKLRTIEESKLGITNNSSGLLMLFYVHGVFFALYYLYNLKKGVDSFFQLKIWIKKICIYLIFLILFLTEGLYWLPVYLCFIYKWKNVKQL